MKGVRKHRLVATKAKCFAALLLAVNLLTACLFGGGDENATNPPGNGDGQSSVGQGATLTCSQECSNRGQCGQSQERGTVVLLNIEAPAVAATDHDLAIAAGTVVEVVEVSPVNVVENATGFEFPVNFYRVFIPDRNTQAWVAGWCVLNAQG